MKTYTLQQLAKENNINIRTLEKRKRSMNLNPIGKLEKSKAKLYNEAQAQRLIDYQRKESFTITKVEVIRITETYYIYPSKMNL